MANNLGLDPFPDYVCHFWPPGGHFGFCRRCGVAGGERVPPAPLGWYFLLIITKSRFGTHLKTKQNEELTILLFDQN